MKIVLSILFSFSLFVSFAQDTIVKRNNDTIIVKVMEVLPLEIKYKRYTMPDGPLYTQNKNDIKSIHYSNGVKEDFDFTPEQRKENSSALETIRKPIELSQKIELFGNEYIYKNLNITEEEMQSVVLNTGDKKIEEYVGMARSAKASQNIVYLTIPCAIAATITIPWWIIYATAFNNNWDDNLSKKNRNLIGACAAISTFGCITFPIVSGVFKRNRNMYNQKAVVLYNQKF